MQNRIRTIIDWTMDRLDLRGRGIRLRGLAGNGPFTYPGYCHGHRYCNIPLTEAEYDEWRRRMGPAYSSKPVEKIIIHEFGHAHQHFAGLLAEQPWTDLEARRLQRAARQSIYLRHESGRAYACTMTWTEDGTAEHYVIVQFRQADLPKRDYVFQVPPRFGADDIVEDIGQIVSNSPGPVISPTVRDPVAAHLSQPWERHANGLESALYAEFMAVA